jgi:Rod binding domain-containing protein
MQPTMSMQPNLAAHVSAPVLPTALVKKDTPAKVQQAAKDFEALLLAQMLKSEREASGGGLTGDGGDESDANSTMIELGEQQFAQALASGGGFGIAKIVETGLTKNADR